MRRTDHRVFWESGSCTQARRLEVPEDENWRLKQIVADHALDIRALKELL